ncbi:MAG TPA: hypothetical protein VM051_04940 [Usitatibacter sp.]|nr:hypothetical protein [Usitatibacter sp.]
MISEPMTLVTDYLLAALTLFLAWRLRVRASRQRARKAWALAFLALGTGAALGGTWHGFTAIDPTLRAVLWKATVLAIGVASAAMIFGSARAMANPRLRRVLAAFAIAVFAVYAGWMLFHDAYVFVVVDTAVAMAIVAALHAFPSAAWRSPGSRWMVGAVALSAIAAAVQASRWAPHPAFNHNDLYHVLQMVAMALFYAGARELRDR